MGSEGEEPPADPYPGYAQCCEHWARIRKSLPPFKFPPQAPALFIELTSDEEQDVETFKHRRAARLAGAKSEAR